MRNVDFQTVHTQTPAVERSFQTRQGQIDQLQRAANEIQQKDLDQEAKEAQEAEETPESKVQLDKETDKEKKKRKKKQQEEEKQTAAPQAQTQTISRFKKGHIDIKV
ncbi:MAG: hypothetical protein GY863_04845 [bacterium]|nr:hypothetical protein [bacterium]